jgi:hypothetical protein
LSWGNRIWILWWWLSKLLRLFVGWWEGRSMPSKLLYCSLGSTKQRKAGPAGAQADGKSKRSFDKMSSRKRMFLFSSNPTTKGGKR